MNRPLALITLVAVALAGCTRSASDEARLRQIVSEHAHARMRVDAYRAAQFGIEEGLDRFGDYPSPAYFERVRKLYEQTRDALKGIDVVHLPLSSRVEYRLIRDDVQLTLASLEYPIEALDLNQMGSRLRTYLDDADPRLSSFPFDTVAHYRAWVKRSDEFPAYVDAQIDALKRGIASGFVLNCIIARNTMHTYEDALEPDVAKNPFHQPLAVMPAGFTMAEKAELTAAIEGSIRSRLVPALQRFDRFFREEYLPKCRQGYGIGGLPRGTAVYALLIRANTDLDLAPEQIHELGLAEVARIEAAMQAIQGTVPRAVVSAAKDASYFQTSAELFAAFRAYQSQVDDVMPRLFRRAPKAPLRIEESGNSEGSSATYVAPTDFQPTGRLAINAANLTAFPRANYKSVYLHEAVPGHHYQLALQFEQKDQLSEYRRKLFDSTAFTEGWALYAERLGREEGLLQQPFERLGSLSEEMLRAVRLVVDTGIHHYAWSRDQAVAYMLEHLPLDRRSVEIEADRYSVWPGQALGYKIGELEIAKLRDKARTALGEGFDLRDFHDVVIGQGTLSLGALEMVVDDWIVAGGGPRRAADDPPAATSSRAAAAD